MQGGIKKGGVKTRPYFVTFVFFVVNLCALCVSALKIVADPSQPNKLGLIRPLADFGGLCG